MKRSIACLCLGLLACACSSAGKPDLGTQTLPQGNTGEAVDQPAAPCRANPNADADVATIRSRGDIQSLPAVLQSRLVRMAGRPHSALPTQAFAEADSPSQLFQYALLDTHGFEPNVFTAVLPGINDKVQRTATGADCGLPTIGAVRMVLEPKPGLPNDPSDVRAFIDIFTDVSVLLVINNESGWYEGWMVHDVVVPTIAEPRKDGHAQFGKITKEDAKLLKMMGSGNNVPGNVFTVDGLTVRLPSEGDRFPSKQSNVVPIPLSMGAWNTLQQADGHAYWEFNYTTNWIFPLYELPFTGGLPDFFGAQAESLRDGEIGRLSSLVPGSGPFGVKNAPQKYGDNPNLPRDPDKFEGADEANEEVANAQREFRMRFIPSGLANEILLDVYVRRASFLPGENNIDRRLFTAYALEVSRVDQDGDGVISAVEGDFDEKSDGFSDNSRLFIPATQYTRFAITREINDGYLAPRFAPTQRAWVMAGMIQQVSPAVPASAGRDADDR